MPNVARHGWQITLVLLGIGYAALAHLTNAEPGNEKLGAFLALAPLVVAILTIAWQSRHRAAMLVSVAILIAITFPLWSTVVHNFYWVYWMDHTGTQLILSAMFARTLVAGREPLCSYFARMVHGTLEPATAEYTRQITIVWMAFFGLMAIVSTALFFFTTLYIWSFFANFLTVPLILAMFVIEYAARRYRFPDMEHVHILVVLKAVRKGFTANKG